MTDRELLKAAAKAAGYPFDEGYFQAAERPSAWWGWVYIDGSGDPPEGPAWTELWNPLTNDGDALRLAVKLGICFNPNFDGDKAVCFVPNGNNIVEPMQPEPYAATRRAIVRAAAALGETNE
jgi:hypothetical protein